MNFWTRLDTAEKITLVIAYLFRAALLVAVANQVRSGNWMLLFLTATTLFMTFLPAIIERNYRITIPVEFTFFMTLFIYMAMFLGEERGYYYKYFWWDKVLHGSSAMIFGFIGFLIVYELYSHRKLIMRPITIAAFSFSFALALGALWEIVEFTIDQNFGTNMQKSGLMDTMGDLIIDSAGALISAIAGFFYVKSGKSFIFDHFVERFVMKNPKIFKRRFFKRKEEE